MQISLPRIKVMLAAYLESVSLFHSLLQVFSYPTAACTGAALHTNAKEKPFTPKTLFRCISCIIDCCWHSPSTLVQHFLCSTFRQRREMHSKIGLRLHFESGKEAEKTLAIEKFHWNSQKFFLRNKKWSFSLARKKIAEFIPCKLNSNARHEATLPKTIYVTYFFPSSARFCATWTKPLVFAAASLSLRDLWLN